jgi:branched-chain amino acid transport system ATP-binding protein
MGTTLSGGEQQMLAIARVLAGAPRLLLIDEPTEGLAPMIVDEIFELIGKLSREGTPIVLVEQNVHRALQLTTRHYLIERGQVIAEGNSSDPGDVQALMGRISV